MQLVKAFVFFIVLGIGSAFGNELDSYYLQQFGELSASPGKASLKSAPAKILKKSGTPLKHGLKRDWKRLAASTQNTLARYLAKPAPFEFPQQITSTGNHFVIHYAVSGPDALDAPQLTDTDNDSIPDWVETVAAVFETVYAAEAQTMGYKAPPTNFNRPYDVYLRDPRNINNFLGVTTADKPFFGTSATSYIEIDKSFEDYPYSPTDLLKITAAHEFHHAIQYGYNYYFDIWYSEATATWIEDEVYDSVNQVYDYLDEYLSNTTTSLNPSATELFLSYSRWLFNRSLHEEYLPRGIDIIRKIWEKFAAEPVLPSGDDIPMLPFIDTALKSQGNSLATSFFRFAKRIYLRDWSSHPDDIIRIPLYSPVAIYSNLPASNSSTPLPAYSFAYYKFIPGTTAPANLQISLPSTANLSITAFRKTAAGAVSEYPHAAGSGSLSIEAFNGPDVAEVALLICNASPATATVSFAAELSPALPRAGDCDKNGIVNITEVQYAIDMFLGLQPPNACVDTSGNNAISTVETQKALNGFLGL